MEITLTDDQEFFRETTRRFLTTECPVTEVRRLESSEDGFEASYWRQGAELGWTCLLVPESLGGGSMSVGVRDLSIVADAFGRSVAPGPLLPTNVVAAAISRSGSDDQRDAVLPGILSGDLVATWCGAELALDPAGEASTIAAAIDGDRVELSGRSGPVEAAAQADQLLVTATSGSGLVQVLVPRDTPGVAVNPLRSLDLVRRFARVDFDGVSLPASAIVGTTDSAAADVERQLQIALAVQTAEMVGAAETTFDFTVEWAFDRYSFGRPLASYQELKHRFADMKMWLEASHGLASALAREVDEESAQAVETASEAKAYIGEYLAELMQDSVQMHGGIGLTTDHDLHIYLRRVTVGRALYGLPYDHRQRLAALHASPAA